jgi:hypothetical protein
VGLLSGVRSDVTSLVLETMEGLVAERALVRAREILSTLVAVLGGIVQERSHEAHSGSGHGGVVELGGVLLVLLLFGGSLWVEEVVKTVLRGSG